MIKVMIADDSAFMRYSIAEILKKAGMEVLYTAKNGLDLLQNIHLKPDVLLLDFDMPEMNGLAVLDELDNRSIDIPTFIISGVKDKELAIKTFEHGAVGFILKPSGSVSLDIGRKADELVRKIKIAYQAKLSKIEKKDIQRLLRPESSYTEERDIIAIGASTGGPSSITKILKRMPRHLNSSILVVQHMPPKFTRSFANRLDEICEIKVKEAEDGDRIEKGSAFIAPGDYHMIVDERDRIHLIQTPKVNGVRPSADVLFESLSLVYGGRVLAILLTGMGADGARGLLKLKLTGAATISEDSRDCVVDSMPESAVKLGAVDIVSRLNTIADEIMRFIH